MTIPKFIKILRDMVRRACDRYQSVTKRQRTGDNTARDGSNDPGCSNFSAPTYFVSGAFSYFFAQYVKYLIS